MFRPLGSFIPTAVLTDIGLFFDKNQLHKFSLASPKANGLFKSRIMMDYKKVGTRVPEKNKISIVLQDIDYTYRKIYIDTDKENLTEKLAILLSTCHSIVRFMWNVDRCTKWNYFMFNEKLIELSLKIEIKKVYLKYCSISVSLPLFLKFLYRHGSILTLDSVQLPSELVSNKTLKLISDFNIYPMEGTNLVVDVNDEFLEGYNSPFHISDFLTKFTINGISAFIQKDGNLSTSFGILPSDQMQDAIDFEIAHPHDANEICLMSTDGQKKLNFCVMIGMNNWVNFSINLETTESDQSAMVPIPNNLFGIVEQESFVKFNKICSNPEESLPISQYQMEYLSIDYEDCVFNIEYTIRGEDREIDIEKTDVTLKDAHKIIVQILRNCTSTEELILIGIKLDEDFYNLLKPIADNIHVPKWRIESTLETESLREVHAATSGLFAKIKLIFDEDEDETDEDDDEVEDMDIDDVLLR